MVTDLERAGEIIGGIESVERLDGGATFGVGTRWRETRTMFGRHATEEFEVIEVEPGRSYTVEADSGGARYTSTVTVEPTGDAVSRLSMTMNAEPQGVLSKAFATTIGRLFEGATRKALEQDLADIAAAAETPPSH